MTAQIMSRAGDQIPVGETERRAVATLELSG
jgi:hypothetical protein